MISGHAKLAGVAGWPIAHSLSPALHEDALQAAGLSGTYRLIDLDVLGVRTLVEVAQRQLVGADHRIRVTDFGQSDAAWVRTFSAIANRCASQRTSARVM